MMVKTLSSFVALVAATALTAGGIWIEIDCAPEDREKARRILRRRGRTHQALVLAR